MVSFKLNGTPYFYTRNGQGDITGLIDASGTEVVKYTYDSWGKPVSITGTLATTVGAMNPYRYRGYRYDTESGLYYLQSRYYDPSIKRFISADIFVSTGQGFSGNNVYAYCGNQPINRSDSGGMFWETAFDVVSLGFSIWEVVQNPKDPWAWAGLVGDAIDLLPIVTGVGETTRAIKTANNLAETADNAADAIKGAGKTLKANEIRFTQNSIKSTFKNGDSVDALIQGLKSGNVSANDIPAIRIFEKDGIFYSLDNRRLYAFKQAGIENFRSVWATAEEIANEAWKFTTKNAGTSILVR